MSRKALIKGLEAAIEAFNEAVEEEGYDPAFFSLDLQGYQLDTEFNQFRHSIKLVDEERGGGE